MENLIMTAEEARELSSIKLSDIYEEINRLIYVSAIRGEKYIILDGHVLINNFVAVEAKKYLQELGYRYDLYQNHIWPDINKVKPIRVSWE